MKFDRVKAAFHRTTQHLRALLRSILMIAFYAVSNLAIINAVNTKMMYFEQEKADLYVRFVNGTPINLLGAVMKLGVFEHVYSISFPTINKKQGILGKIPYVRTLFYGRKMQQFVYRYLDVVANDVKYDIMLTLHMDAHAVYFANYFRRSNRKIRIEFFEDGTASYLCTKKYLTSPIQSTLSTIRFLAKKLSECYYYWQIRKNITDRLYIYYPQGYDRDKGFVPLPLTMQSAGLELLQKLAQSIDESLVMRYNRKTIFYLANPKTAAEPTYDFSYSIIEHIMAVANSSSIAIKTHSNASTENKNEFAAEYEDRIFVDRNVYLFEGLIYALHDVEHKIIISRASTASMFPKLWLQKEPYIILTLRLYPYYGESGDPGGDEYIDLLRSLYSKPNRILVPNTLADLELMLRHCLTEIYDDLYYRE